MTDLLIDADLARRARDLAARVGQPIVDLAQQHTTVSVERSVLRLAGATGDWGARWVERLDAAGSSAPAAAVTAASSGRVVAAVRPRLEGTCLNAWPGGVCSSSRTSDGKITQVGASAPTAIRMARSIRLGSCSGTVHICT